MRFKKLDKNAVEPSKAHSEDAGFDLASVGEVLLPPETITTVNRDFLCWLASSTV